MSRRSRAALLALLPFLFSPSVPAVMPDGIDVALQDTGEVRLPAGALREHDYLIAVYAERPQDLSSGSFGRLPGTLPNGCLPLVQIHTASGSRRLSAAAEISFGCTDLPASAGIYAFRDGQWVALHSERMDDGRIAAHFQDTAVFGVFLQPENNAPRI